MKYIFKTEKILISVTCVVCTLLILKLLYSLRTIFPWRVNCWFCNSNFWVKFCERNSWTCRKCEQYNGFTKDGDYNKPIFAASTNENTLNTPKVFRSSPPRNGLCKMCNINQQLKVAQLANYVPMNERNFDEEIESYRMQLEKAYKLCSPCKKVLQTKLHKEKEVLLGTKLLEARTPDRKAQKQMENTKLLSFFNTTYFLTASVLMILISIECYTSVAKNEHLVMKISNIKDVFTEFLERILLILKMKLLMTFPVVEKYLIDIPQLIDEENWMSNANLKAEFLEKYSVFVHEAVGSTAIIMLFVENYFNKSKSKSYILTEAIWSIFMMTCFFQHLGAMDIIIISLWKLLCIVTILFLNGNANIKSIKQTRKISTSPKNIKNLTSNPTNSMIDEDDSMETDDDVSLSQFGLHNFSDSSNETAKVAYSSLISGRAFTPRSENNSIWKKPKLNSTFCANSVLKSPSSVSEIIFAKPNYQKAKQEESFHKYQNLTKEDFDSDLDESISSLCIGSPKKAKRNGSIFSLRKFTATPNFVAPTPLTRARPLISPSKLGHSTSWVAGGYWGSEGERHIFSVDGSRSSSQSSGFESQASSNQRNVLSQPPSREESVCGEPVLSDRFQSCNMNNFGQGPHQFSGPQKFPSQTPSSFSCQTPSSYSRIGSPVYPQMQYNRHVHIPQPRFAQQTRNVFGQQPFGQTSLFKAPGGSGLIKLPQSNSFSSR